MEPGLQPARSGGGAALSPGPTPEPSPAPPPKRPRLPLFEHTDFLQQRTKLMSMLDLLVSIADQPDRLIRQAALLGRSHAGYELGSREFEVMGEALLWTLDRMLGLNFTPEMRTAWGELYALVSSVMRRAAGRISAAAVEVPHLPPDTDPDTFPG